MNITSLDILNLSHSLKDVCEVNCNTSECLSRALKILAQYNLFLANLQFSRQFDALPTTSPSDQAPNKAEALAEEASLALDVTAPFRSDLP